MGAFAEIHLELPLLISATVLTQCQHSGGGPSPNEVLEAMKQRIDNPEGRRRYSQRIGTVEPVFSNIRHNKRLNRSRCVGAMGWARRGGCIAWCTTSRNWLGTT